MAIIVNVSERRIRDVPGSTTEPALGETSIFFRFPIRITGIPRLGHLPTVGNSKQHVFLHETMTFHGIASKKPNLNIPIE